MYKNFALIKVYLTNENVENVTTSYFVDLKVIVKVKMDLKFTILIHLS